MTNARTKASELLPTKYVSNWFGASDFFNTQSTSVIRKGLYFITHDKFMTSDIYALRFINAHDECIDTIVSGTKAECEEALKNV